MARPRRGARRDVRRPLGCALLFAAAWSMADGSGAGPKSPVATVEGVRRAGFLACGINRAEADYSKDDTHGSLAAFDADLCKAIAAAVLGTTARVIITSFPDEPHALRALQSGRVDVVAGATPSAMNRTVYSVGFGPTMFFDAQGFLVNVSSGVKRLEDLDGKPVCYIGNTQADVTLHAVMQARGIHFVPFPFEERGEMEAALFTGHCAAMTADLSQLGDTLASLRGAADRFEITAETIGDDPYAPAYRDADAGWADIVDGTMDALLQAEACGVTAADLDTMRQEAGEKRSPLAGWRGAVRAGLDAGWVASVLAAVGHYGDLFERDLGTRSPMRLGRGGAVRCAAAHATSRPSEPVAPERPHS